MMLNARHDMVSSYLKFGTAARDHHAMIRCCGQRFERSFKECYDGLALRFVVKAAKLCCRPGTGVVDIVEKTGVRHNDDSDTLVFVLHHDRCRI